jgi:hypothetical protein
VKGEHDVRQAVTRKDAMGARLPSAANQYAGGRQEPATHGCLASYSRSYEGNIEEVWTSFAMFKPISDDPQRQGLCARSSLRNACSVSKDAGEVGDLRDPATILFLFDLDLEPQA